MGKLKTKDVERETLSGKYPDGDGLTLIVRRRPTGITKTWTLRFTSPVTKRQREAGLGVYPEVTLDRARAAAAAFRAKVRQGFDPLTDGVDPSGARVTFAAASADFIKTKRSGWANQKHAAQWQNTLDKYCACIANKRVADINREDVVRVLSQIWLDRMETATRVRGRMERVIDYAVAKGWRADELANPAEMNERLRALLPDMPSKAKRVEHHSALDWRDLPDFMAALKERPALAARLLEFTILAASRIGESGGARWREFDKAITTWKIPAERTKMRAAHTVPLSRQAHDVVKRLVVDAPILFPIAGKSPSANATRALILRMDKQRAWRNKDGDLVTTHGFRSTFRDWCADNGHDQELAEAALAHVAGGVERAYRRTDLLDRRRELMQAWGDYCWSKRT